MGASLTDQVDRLRAALADRYQLEEEIGRGGMACVYRAHDRRHGRDVAIKVLRPELSAALGAERFLREIRIAARLQHPHILPLYDSGSADGFLYYVMPCMRGETLRDRLRREKQLPLATTLRIAAEVAAGLGHAHSLGLLHRDIKPGNILFDGEHALLADFGIAKAISAADPEALTDTGIILGTPEYMSPEQGAGEDALDQRSDIYSLGCVVYEMLAGQPPFSGRTVQSVLARHRQDPPPSLRVVRPGLTPALEQAVQVALAKVPADRYATTAEFVAALTEGPARFRMRALRGRTAIWLGAGLTAAALAVGLGLRPAQAPLDPQRVVVFPIRSSAPEAGGRRDDASLALLASLNTTSSLSGIDGGELNERGEPLTPALARRLARKQGAAYYLEASLLSADSLRLLLDLHDLRDRSVAHRMVALGLDADGWSVGVRAALELLPLLLRTGRPAELPLLTARSPASLTEYFLGERAYRRGAFVEALGHFQRAVRADSGFALAALRGVQAASWDRRAVDAAALLAVALARERELPPRLREYARGVDARLAGRADSAVARFRAALALAPDAAEAWMGLGETYNHLLPSGLAPDSMAEDAFRQVQRLEPGFAPALVHLIEFAVRRGDRARAVQLAREYESGAPDPEGVRTVELLLGCLADSMSAGAWRAAVLRGPAEVLDAAYLLAVNGLRRPGCARDAWEAVLHSDTTSGSAGVRNRFGSLVGLHGVHLAQGRVGEVRRLLESDTVSYALYRGRLYTLGALAGPALTAEADAYADAQRQVLRSNPEDLNNLDLWFLGIWAAQQGRAAEVAELADRILRRAAESNPRRDSLLAAGLYARAALARRDTADALRRLRALVPTTASHQELAWNPWESLAGERLLLARLALATGQTWEALEVATGFDSPVPIAYVMYLPASLSVRIEAAGRLGEYRIAQLARDRLRALQVAGPQLKDNTN